MSRGCRELEFRDPLTHFRQRRIRHRVATASRSGPSARAESRRLSRATPPFYVWADPPRLRYNKWPFHLHAPRRLVEHLFWGFLASQATKRPRSPHRRPSGGRRGQVDTPILVGAIVLALAGIFGAWWLLGRGEDAETDRALMHRVTRGEFLLEITERGDLESSDVVEVRSQVKSKNTQGTAILTLIKEGTRVQKGDLLVQLDASALENEFTNQQILVFSAESVMIGSKNAHKLANIAKQEYLEGTFVELEQTIEGEIFVAEENLSRAKEYLKYSERLAAKGHITEYQLEADAFAVEKAEKDLQVAKTKLDVLRRFTKAKMVTQLDSDIATTKAKWEADQKSYELEFAKLEEIRDQVDKCKIVAPSDGTVVYAHDRDGRGGEDFVIEEGAVVREGQTLIRLPNQTQMQVEVKINESLVKYVEAGQRAAILPIGFDKPLMGTVTLVNQFSEPQNWRRPDVREYKTQIRVDEDGADLRSGMTAQVTIQCSYLPNVLQIPVQTVYAHGKKFYCFLRDDDGWKAEEVQRGPTNEKFFVVESGLEEGQEIALTPRKLRDKVELPELAVEKQQTVVGSVEIPESERVVREPGKGLPGGGGAGGGAAAAMIARLDTNSDGKVELTELPGGFRERAKALDRNGDGVLDSGELQAIAAMAAGRGGGGGGPGGRPGGPGGGRPGRGSAGGGAGGGE